MIKHILPASVFLVTILFPGCQCSTDKSRSGSPAVTQSHSMVEERDSTSFFSLSESVSAEETAPTQEEIEEFYQSLPIMSLPINWETDPKAMIEVPERIYMGEPFGFSYPYEAFYAARLPERDGLRFVLVHLEDMGEFVTVGLFIFNAAIQRLDHRYIYTVREIDGGQNVLVRTFVIGEDLEIVETSEFHGRGPGDEYLKVIFQREYFKPFADGRIGNADASGREIIRYTEEEFIADEGGIYGTYNFTVSTFTPIPARTDGEWEYMETMRRYTVNDEGQLVELDD